MPFKIRKVTNRNCYEVYKPKTGRKYAKCTTMKKAKKQVALLHAIEHNPDFVPRKAMGGKKKTEKKRDYDMKDKRKRRTEKKRRKTTKWLW